jgi:hypothetical protein
MWKVYTRPSSASDFLNLISIFFQKSRSFNHFSFNNGIWFFKITISIRNNSARSFGLLESLFETWWKFVFQTEIFFCRKKYWKFSRLGLLIPNSETKFPSVTRRCWIWLDEICIDDISAVFSATDLRSLLIFIIWARLRCTLH